MKWFKTKKDKKIEMLEAKIDELYSEISDLNERLCRKPKIVTFGKSVRTLQCSVVITKGEFNLIDKDFFKKELANKMAEGLEDVIKYEYEEHHAYDLFNGIPEGTVCINGKLDILV